MAFGDELPAGTVLCGGQYVIERFLNSGGFGVTYLARDSLDRKVVIKECFPNAMCCREGQAVRLRSRAFETDFNRSVELFQKEARALARLQHPSIVGVHQIFEANGTAYMALDFVTGMDLSDLMLRHPGHLTPPVVTGIVRALLKALVVVHDTGILHRDISPDNILLDANGAPVLIDFGAARQSASRATRVLTRVHAVKDGYSPYEFYVEGQAQSRASDLYALAATAVHLVTGAPPPGSSVRLAALSEEQGDPWRGLGAVPGYDPAFLACIDRCMSLPSRERLQSASEWLEAMGAEAAQPVVAEVSAEPQPRGADLGDCIAEMVARNNAALAEDTRRRTERPPADAAPARDREAERRAAERAYWAILNEDPRALAEEARREREALERAEARHKPEPGTARARPSRVLSLLGFGRRGTGPATGTRA